MNNDREALRRLDELHEPRHLFILPSWINPAALDRLIDGGYLTFTHLQRSNGEINLIMGLQLTPKGIRRIASHTKWSQLALKGSLAGVSLTAVSAVILYLG